jgi:hypothetical protein
MGDIVEPRCTQSHQHEDMHSDSITAIKSVVRSNYRTMDVSSGSPGNKYRTLDVTGTPDSVCSPVTHYNIPVRNSYASLADIYADVVKQGAKAARNNDRPRHSSPKPARSHNTGRCSTRIPVVHGMGKYSGMKATQMNMTKRRETTSANKTLTGLFITRVNPRTTTKQLELQIKRETSINIRVEKLRTKYPTYSSFFIRCDRHVRQTMWEPSLWPQVSLIIFIYLSIF